MMRGPSSLARPRARVDPILRSGLLLLSACYVVTPPTPAPDEMDPDSEGHLAGDAGPERNPTRHTACRQALPDSFPAEPSRPQTNAWQDIACDEAKAPIPCSVGQLCPNAAACLLMNGFQGVCAEAEQGSTPFHYRAGGCHEYVSPAWKRGVCCAGVVGADCRAEPLPNASKPGEGCTKHAECETGLLCQADALGLGICVCPGVDAARLGELPDCRQAWFGGQEPTPAMAPGECRAAMADGYSVESLPAQAGTHLLATATDWAGSNILITRKEPDEIRMVWGNQGAWTYETIGNFDVQGLDMALDAPGFVHVAMVVDGKLQYSVRHPTWRTWTTTDFSQHGHDLHPVVRVVNSQELAIIVAAEHSRESGNYELFALMQKRNLGTVSWQRVDGIAKVKQLVSFAVHAGNDGRLHTLVEDGAGIQYKLTVDGFTDDSPGYPGRGATFIASKFDALDFGSVSASDTGSAQVILDTLETGSIRRRAIYTNPVGYPSPISTPAAAADTDGELFTAFRSGLDPLRTGIYLLEGGTSQAKVTRLMAEPFEPQLIVTGPSDGPQQPHVFYEAQRPSAFDPNTLSSDIRHVFKGPCVGPQNAQCATPLQGELPLEPAITMQDGRPLFDLWHDLDCSEVADYPLCGEGHFDDSVRFNCDVCLTPPNGSEGVCTPIEQFDSCEDGPLSLGDGACAACAPSEAKTRACCAVLPGIDCRHWPFLRSSKRGQDCARHDDCEPGLVCRADSTMHALCVCPEEDSAPFGSPYCAELARKPDACRPALAPGYVYEELPTEPGEFIVGTPVAGPGQLHLLAGPEAKLVSFRDGAWSVYPLGHDLFTGTLAMDSVGRLHTVSSTGSQVGYERLDPDGSWHRRMIIDYTGAHPDTSWDLPVFALRADDTPVLVFNERADNTIVALFSTDKPSLEDWQARSLYTATDQVEHLAAAIDDNGDLRVIVSELHGNVTSLLVTATGVQTEVLGDDDFAFALPNKRGLEEWLGTKISQPHVTLHDLSTPGHVRELGIDTEDLWTAPVGLRRPNGDLAVAYQSLVAGEGIMLYQETSTGSSTTKLTREAYRKALIADPAGKLHFFVDMGMVPTGPKSMSLGIRHYFEGACD